MCSSRVPPLFGLCMCRMVRQALCTVMLPWVRPIIVVSSLRLAAIRPSTSSQGNYCIWSRVRWRHVACAPGLVRVPARDVGTGLLLRLLRKLRRDDAGGHAGGGVLVEMLCLCLAPGAVYVAF